MPTPTITLGASRANFRANEALGWRVWQGDCFCHYTDLVGLKGIVENNEIWLSDHRFLNDPSENSYGQHLSIETIKALIEEEKGNEFSLLLNDILNEINVDSQVFYIASMSVAIDRLDQWKYYGRGSESVCLVFENDFSLGRDGALTRLPAIEPLKVIYQPQEQVKRIKKVVSIFREEFVRNPCKISETFSLWKNDMLFLLAQQLIRFKDEEFSSEEEVRLVVSKNSPILNGKPQHRISNGRIIPFVTTKNPSLPKAALLPLKEVIISPIATQDSVVRSIEVFLYNMGYQNVVVSRSTIKFRG